MTEVDLEGLASISLKFGHPTYCSVPVKALIRLLRLANSVWGLGAGDELGGLSV